MRLFAGASGILQTIGLSRTARSRIIVASVFSAAQALVVLRRRAAPRQPKPTAER
jgi:hypothetical protein